jgi:luciferase family oxidoreductase group 1
MPVTRVPLSILDLASIGDGESVRESLEGCVKVAQHAEQLGFTRVWYAEHHNSEAIASSSPAVLIAHVAAHTSTIRLGSGGVMLPNHSPLVIAEQFGTLATLHPGRIDLGLGRAPGTDQNTVRAMRRDPNAAENFAQDVAELRGLLSDTSPLQNVMATPGRGTHVPLYILGSSLFGAQMAAAYGLPYAFASHFAPQMLHDAVRIYRERFRPSTQLAQPHVIASINVIAADTEASAQKQLERRRRVFAKALFSPPGSRLTDEQAEEVLRSPRGAYLDQIFTYTAVGTPDMVKNKLADFEASVQPDEIMTVHHADCTANRLRSLELLAEVTDLAGNAVAAIA